MEKFEVGDKVKIIRMDTKWSAYHKCMNKYIGTIGEIVKTKGIVTDDDPYHDVKLFDDLEFSMKDEWFELVEKKKIGWNGKVVCTESDYYIPVLFTPGKVYDVVNGNLIGNVLDDRGAVTTGEWFFESPEDIDNRVLDYRFVEFKGFAGK